MSEFLILLDRKVPRTYKCNGSLVKKVVRLGIFSILLFLCGMVLIEGCARRTVRKVTVGKDLFLRVGGKSFFPIGSYHKPSGSEPFQELSKQGFNLIRLGPNQEEWQRAHEAGLYVWSSWGGTFDFSKDREKKEEEMKARVKELKNHPALLFWESIDEPAWTWKKPWLAHHLPEGMIQGYRFLQGLDHSHPVYLNHAPRNTVETLRKYNDSADIISVDIYPVIAKGISERFAITPDGRQGDLLNQYPSCVGEYVQKMRRVTQDKKPVFIVLQAFSWEDKDPEKILYPTYEESRFMAYDAIINGARGLTYFGRLDTKSKFYKELGKVIRELNSMIPVFLSPEVNWKIRKHYHEMGFSIDRGVEIMVKKVGRDYVILAANTSIDPTKVTFSGLVRLRRKELKVLFEDRSVSLKDGSFMDEFAGLGVHLYATARLHDDLKLNLNERSKE